jgi:hypothetical protein
MDFRIGEYLFNKYIYPFPPLPNQSSQYFNRVYLCIEKKNNNDLKVIEGFNCYRFMNIDDAEIKKSEITSSKERTDVIPICKWVPFIFDSCILDYKLRKKYWSGKHRLCFFRKM